MADADTPDSDDINRRAHARSPDLGPADLAAIADHTFDLLSIGAGGRLIALNAAFERVLGWSAAELMARPFFDFVHPDDLPATHAAWRRLLTEDRVVDFENRVRHRSGGWRWLQWRAGALPDGRLHAAARDVTAQRRERLLIDRTHRIARVGGWQLDFASGALYWTAGAHRLHGLDPTALDPDRQSWLELYRPPDRARLSDALEAIEAHGTPFDLDLRATAADGRAIRVRLEGVPIIEDGAVVGAFGAVGDVTERRRSEHRIARADTLVRTSPHAVMFAGLDRRLQWFNPAAAALLGLDDGMIGQSAAPAFTAASYSRFEAHIMPRLMTEGSWQGELEAHGADGASIPVHATVALHRSPDGQPEFMSATLEDLRRQRSLEGQIRHSQRVEGLGRLAGGLAHDFNNLLTVVLANADELRDALADSALRPLVDEIAHAADRGSDITRRLLGYARQDIARPQAVDLVRTCVDLARVLRRTLGEHITIRVDPPADNWPVRIDPTHLDQLLMNLAMNARDAMPDGGWLTFELANRPGVGGRPDQMRLAVCDGGHGMPPEVVARAFDPFFTTKARDRGTGLGLATCQGLVAQAGGRIEIHSEQRIGTRIVVDLPRAPGAPPQPIAARVDPVGTGDEQLMVIEDEAAIRSAVAKGLRQYGYRVEAFATGEDAVAAVGEGLRPDLIVSDVVLTGIDGPAAVRRIRQRMGRVAVIFVSGYAAERLAPIDLQDPSVRLVHKPYTPRRLEPVIRSMLGEHGASAPRSSVD